MTHASRWREIASTLLAGTLLASIQAHAANDLPVLRVVAPTNQSMPLLRMAENRPVDGLLIDVGEALADRLSMLAVFVPLPSKRAGPAVSTGVADLLCYVKAGWLEDNLLWTQAFLAGTAVIAAHADAPAVSRLQALRDEPLGTVLGYRYPVLDQAFMQPMRREDVADAETNLRRLALGRVRYAVTDRAALNHFLRANPAVPVREVMEVERYQLGCAVAPDKAWLVQPLNRAIQRMQIDGTLETLLSRYR